jgi:hypothetical protein
MLAKSISQQNPEALLLEYCKDINDWPSAWEGLTADIKTGHAILEHFKPFLIGQIKKGKSKRTIKNYAQYLWVLGGELIRQVNDNSYDRRLSAEKLILKYIDASGGLYWCHANDESEHNKYDSVCKKLFKFMTTNSD